MTHASTPNRSAMTAIAAVLALSPAPLLAQVAAPQAAPQTTMPAPAMQVAPPEAAAPVAPPTATPETAVPVAPASPPVAAQAPAPTTPAAPVANGQQAQIVMKPQAEVVQQTPPPPAPTPEATDDSATAAAAEKAPAPKAKAERKERVATAAPTPKAAPAATPANAPESREAPVAPVAAAPVMAPAPTATDAIPPVQQAEPQSQPGQDALTAAYDSPMLPWIAGGVVVLLGAGAGFAFMRRRRDEEAEVRYDATSATMMDAPATADPLFANKAPATAATPVDPLFTPKEEPAFVPTDPLFANAAPASTVAAAAPVRTGAIPPEGSDEEAALIEAMANEEPSDENPFLTHAKRVRRARQILAEQREAAPVAATEAPGRVTVGFSYADKTPTANRSKTREYEDA